MPRSTTLPFLYVVLSSFFMLLYYVFMFCHLFLQQQQEGVILRQVIIKITTHVRNLKLAKDLSFKSSFMLLFFYFKS